MQTHVTLLAAQPFSQLNSLTFLRLLERFHVVFHVSIFRTIINLELLFSSTAFVDTIIRGNVIYNLFYQHVVNMGIYLPQKRKVRENNECRQAFSILRQILKSFPILTTN